MYRPYPMRWLRHAAIILLCFSVQQIAAQCGFKPLTLQQKASAASAIARVHISSSKTFIGNKGYVYTTYTAAVKAWLKKGAGASITLEMVGGIHQNRATVVSGSVMLSTGGEYLLFLKEDKSLLRSNKAPAAYQLLSPVQGALQSINGVYYDDISKQRTSEAQLFAQIESITRTAARTPTGAVYKTPVAQRTLAVQAVNSFTTGANISGSVLAADHLKIYGSGFGTATGQVAFANADDGGATQITPPFAADYISWTDTYIEVKVPDGAGNGLFYVAGPTTQTSPSPLAVNYALNNVYSNFSGYAAPNRHRPKLLNRNNSGGYSFSYNNNFSVNAPAVAAFSRALNSWRCGSGVNFTTTASSVTTEAANDGVNVVQFETATTPLGLGTLGVAITNYGGTAIPGVCDQQNTVWYVSDIDVVFSDVPYTGYTWQYGTAAATGSQFDFESVALHEVGHAHGLGHVIAPGHVMHYALGNGQTSRTLSTNDVAGGKDMVTYSGSACVTPAGYFGPMTAVTCTLPLQFTAFDGNKNSRGANVLQWVTQNEKDNKGFWVQRSPINGNNFEAIGFVQGSNATAAQYSFTDVTAGTRHWLYRLQQVDRNNHYSYSDVVRIDGSTSKASIWSSGKTVLVQVPQTAVKAILQLYSSDGRLLATQVLQRGENGFGVNITGIVHYVLATDGATQTGKLYLQ